MSSRTLGCFQVSLVSVLVLMLALSQSGQSGLTPQDSWAKHPQSRALLRRIDQLALAVRNREYFSSVPEGRRLLTAVIPLHRPDLEQRVRKILGGAELGAGLYREALSTLLPARKVAMKGNDAQNLFSFSNNIGWIYFKMNNLEAAAEFADQALAAARASGTRDARPLILRALVYSGAHDFSGAERLFLNAINRLVDEGDLESAAIAWNFLGSSYFEAHRLLDAQRAQTESFRLRKLHHLSDLEVSLRDLGTVYCALGDIDRGSVLVDEALRTAATSRSTAPLWAFYRDRGRVRMMQGNLAGAVPDFRHALELARRVEIIPTDDDRVTFESGLADLYSLFIDTGNQLYFQNHDEELKREIFETAEQNRAASLRALVPQPHDWRTRLTPEYRFVLARLQLAERDALSQAGNLNTRTQQQIGALRARLSEMELRAGAEEDTAQGDALTTARRVLTPETALLTFHLGAERSWLWSITDQSFDVYALASKAELARSAARFRESILRNTPDLPKISHALAQKLFGGLPGEVHNRDRWILALDQDLFDLSFPALLWNGQYLAQRHALLTTPSVYLLEASTKPVLHGPLSAMGDAIYNRADTRWRPQLKWSEPATWFGPRPGPEVLHLARLNGTGDEVRSAVRIWGAGTVFTGSQAVKANLPRLLDTRPAILHFATHVIKAPRYSSGMLVLGLDGRGEPEFLDMRDILLHPMNTPLVVMSGCASGDAIALPASGLMGLTRAWIGAGASEVLATRWPTLDDTGPFFVSFYRNLHQNPDQGADRALRRAQVEMINSHSFRSNPEYWGSYFLVGKL